MADVPLMTVIRAVVHASIDTGAMCQRLGSFLYVEGKGVPARSAYDVMTDRAIAAMLAVWPRHVETLLHAKPEVSDAPGEADG